MRDDKTYAVYTHRVVTEDNGPMYYVGITTNTKRRWFPSQYRTDALWPYIVKYGWDNIEHRVFADGLDRETALRLEDTLILLYRGFGCCINQQRSGHIYVSDVNTYARKLYANNPKHAENQRKYCRDRYTNDQEYAEQKRKRERNRYKNDPEYAERQRKMKREKLATPEGKIYDRVKKFNYAHPDRITESPLEARDKYLTTGYIPQYIKHDDL